jgi:hypothetical protein
LAGTKLTDKQKKKIIADYIENQNFSETARMNNVNKSTVKRLVDSGYDKDLQQKATEKKEENTKDILKYMDEIYDKQKSIIDLSLSALQEKLKKPDMFTNVRDIAMVYGVIFDKALKYKEVQRMNGNTEGLNKVKELLEKIEKEAGK